jgi:hypothetical protein
MGDINRPSEEGEKDTDNDEPHRHRKRLIAAPRYGARPTHSKGPGSSVR